MGATTLPFRDSDKGLKPEVSKYGAGDVKDHDHGSPLNTVYAGHRPTGACLSTAALAPGLLPEASSGHNKTSLVSTQE